MNDTLFRHKIFYGIKGKIKLKESLAKHTTLKIGGPAEFFIEPNDLKDLKSLITRAARYKIPFLVIGAGSNLLISDKGVKAIVLKLSGRLFKKVSFHNNCLTAGCSVPLKQIILQAAKRSLSGVEFLVGIPGTLGGALYMNAGAWGKNIGNLVENVKVMDYNGRIKVINKKHLKFGYRKSCLAKYIILSAEIKLCKKNRNEIGGILKKYLAYRRLTQDYTFPNAGCIFKNPVGQSAGQLIDLCGLKGTRCRGALISSRHANFILNRKQATSSDVLKLMHLIVRRVKHKFNVQLEPEIRIWQ